FEIGTLFGQFFDRVTAIAKNSLVSVYVGDPADARGGVVERRIVAHQAKIVGIHLDLAEVHGADGAVGDGYFVGLAGAVVGDGNRVAGSRGVGDFFRISGGCQGTHILASLYPSF